MNGSCDNEIVFENTSLNCQFTGSGPMPLNTTVTLENKTVDAYNINQSTNFTSLYFDYRCPKKIRKMTLLSN